MGGDVVGNESIRSIVVPAGEMTANISVELVDDTIEEESETFLVMLIASSCCSQIPTLATTITTVEIIDDDEGS